MFVYVPPSPLSYNFNALLDVYLPFRFAINQSTYNQSILLFLYCPFPSLALCAPYSRLQSFHAQTPARPTLAHKPNSSNREHNIVFTSPQIVLVKVCKDTLRLQYRRNPNKFIHLGKSNKA